VTPLFCSSHTGVTNCPSIPDRLRFFIGSSDLEGATGVDLHYPFPSIEVSSSLAAISFGPFVKWRTRAKAIATCVDPLTTIRKFTELRGQLGSILPRRVDDAHETFWAAKDARR
jgi:hypothetical protein